jgi:DNA-binding response OmpR family regulator
MKTDDFLDKPVPPAVLLDRVGKLLEKKGENT